MKGPKKPAFIGGRVPRPLRDRLLDVAILLDVPYIQIIELALEQALPGMELAAQRVRERGLPPLPPAEDQAA